MGGVLYSIAVVFDSATTHQMATAKKNEVSRAHLPRPERWGLEASSLAKRPSIAPRKFACNLGWYTGYRGLLCRERQEP